MTAALGIASRAAIAAAALAFGMVALLGWVADGRSPLARELTDVGPVLVFCVLGIGLLGGLVTRSSTSSLAGGALIFAALANISRELAPFASNAQFGDGPALWPAYVAGALLLSVYVQAGRRLAPDGVRLAALAVFLSTANGKLFERDENGIYLLIAASVILALGSLPKVFAPLRPGERWIVLVALVFVAWVALAALLGDSPGRGIRQLSRVSFGALLALCLARGGGLQLARHVTLMAVFGLLLTSLLWAAGWGEAIPVEGFTRVTGTRLRLYGMNPNGIGPFFAASACLCAGFALGPRNALLRSGLVGLALLATAGVLLTRSSASLGGWALGMVTVLLLRFALVPRKAWTLPATVLGGFFLTAGWFASPLGAGLREQLDGMTQSQSALGQRYYLWRMAGEAIAASPWVGHGPGQFYVHAQFARPSFFDGTSQILHPHNLWLAIAEGAGIPAALLFTALVLLTFEVARRRIRSGGLQERSLAAGWLGGLFALLAANLLDLGQSQQTFVPMLLWIALGVLGALTHPESPESARDDPLAAPEPARPWFQAALSALALLAVVGPLSAATLARQGSIALAKGEFARSERAIQIARWLAPLDHRLLASMERIRRGQKRPAEALEFARGVVLGTPSRAAGWLNLTRKAFDLGIYEGVAESLEQARRLDPLGSGKAETLALEARFLALRGDLEGAYERLSESLLNQGRPWQSWSLRQASDGTTRLHSGAKGESGFSLLELTQETMRSVLESVRTDPVRARRQVEAVAEATSVAGRPDLAAEWLATVQDATEDRGFVSLTILEARAWCAAGKPERALERISQVLNPEYPYYQLLIVQTLNQLETEPDLLQLSQTFAGGDVLLRGRDLFLEAGAHATMIEALLEWRLRQGEGSAALEELGRLRRELSSESERGAASLRAATRLVVQPTNREPGLKALLLGLCDLAAAAPPEVDLRLLGQAGRIARDSLSIQETEALRGRVHRLVPKGPVRGAFLAALTRAPGQFSGD